MVLTANSIRMRALRDSNLKNPGELFKQHRKSLGYGSSEPVPVPEGSSAEVVEAEKTRRRTLECAILDFFDQGRSHTQQWGLPALAHNWELVPSILREAPLFKGHKECVSQRNIGPLFKTHAYTPALTPRLHTLSLPYSLLQHQGPACHHHQQPLQCLQDSHCQPYADGRRRRGQLA